MNNATPDGFEPVTMDPLMKKLEYDVFATGRVVTYLHSKRIKGSDGQTYDYHIVVNETGQQRGLFGTAQLTTKLRKAGAGASVWLRYGGKIVGNKPGRTEHVWDVAVRGNSLIAPTADDSEPEGF